MWGQGLATEAALACRNYGFDHLSLPRLSALIHPENLASRRVAEKIGITLLRPIPHRGRIRCLYSMEHPQAKWSDITSCRSLNHAHLRVKECLFVAFMHFNIMSPSVNVARVGAFNEATSRNLSSRFSSWPGDLLPDEPTIATNPHLLANSVLDAEPWYPPSRQLYYVSIMECDLEMHIILHVYIDPSD
ncbi:GNAT family N-acetyltransferase [Ktedonobacter sp. SOSP1-52]|uniref:GNAT family N-acetyltransferase n=1 Tax=Ktedonobacter sp. SOSP1-52 TaxID=2778366 RepID=UPI0019153F7F